MEPQIIRVPITRLDESKHMVYGYASTGAIDTYGTIVDPGWWPQAVTGYKETRTVSEMHLDLYGEPISETAREPMVIGTVPMFEIDDRGIWIGAEITNEATWEKIDSGDYNGFSVQIMPFEFRDENVEGHDVVRFTKYHLTDITVGYPAANLDARFQLIERLASDDSSPWDWDWGKDADAIVEKSGWKGLGQACMYKDPDADPETKAAYKLPVAKLKNGELTVYWNGVRAAMAALNGARGGIDISDNERKKIYNRLAKLYKKFDKEQPEFRLETGGNIMSKFVEKVTKLVQRLAGKAPDEAAAKEIESLETELADDKTKQIEELAGSIQKLTERLENVEKGQTQGSAPTDKETETGKKIGELTTTIGKLEQRLDAAEKSIARTQQPGEGQGGSGGGGDGKNMNDFIRASANRQ